MASAPSKAKGSSACSLPYKIEAVTPSIALGEGPFWSLKKELLYYINLYKSEVHSYDPKTRENIFIKVGDKPTTFVIPLAGREDEFAIGYGRDVQILKWDGKSQNYSLKPYTKVERRPDSRLNDAKASPSRVLFVGSMGNEHGGIIPGGEGGLYVVKDENVTTLLDGVGISNGLAWNADETEMYWNDTLTTKTYKFKYDRQTHTISDQKMLLDFKAKNIPGLPDGMTIDTEGKLWIACIKGSQIMRVNPETGDVLLTIPLPCTDVTSLAFGGPKLNVLYLTTSLHNVDENDKTPEAGCILQITGLPYCGLPSNPVEL